MINQPTDRRKEFDHEYAFHDSLIGEKPGRRKCAQPVWRPSLHVGASIAGLPAGEGYSAAGAAHSIPDGCDPAMRNGKSQPRTARQSAAPLRSSARRTRVRLSLDARMILISPFLKLNDRMQELLADKNPLKIDVRIVCGKSELQPQEIESTTTKWES